MSLVLLKEIIGKVEGTVTPVPKCHTMKACKECRGKASHILDLRGECSASHSSLLTSREGSPVPSVVWVAPELA